MEEIMSNSVSLFKNALIENDSPDQMSEKTTKNIEYCVSSMENTQDKELGKLKLTIARNSFYCDASDTENVSWSSTQESASIEEHSDGTFSEEEDDQLSYIEEEDSEEFVVSKYMESKLAALEKTRFGVWKVETQTNTDRKAMDLVGRSSTTWKVDGCSDSLSPLKLTLKKSQTNLLKVKDKKPPKVKTEKRKYNRKNSLSEPKESKRGPGRPRSRSCHSKSKQKLIDLFKRKYLKDRKRRSSTKSTSYLPPTIRSIAKP